MAVVYDNGSVGPAEIAAAAATCAVDVRLVIDRSSQHVAQVAPVLARRFSVCDITGATPDEATTTVAALQPDGIVTFSDLCMRTTSMLADGCGLAHWHTPRVTELLTDKLAQRRALAAAGVDATRSVEISTAKDVADALAVVGLPAVLKPRRGTGGQHVQRVDDVAGAVAAARRYFTDRRNRGPLLVEELLHGDSTVAGAQWGDYVSVEALVHNDRYEPLCVIGKFPLATPFRERGFFVPATLDAATTDQVLAVARAAVRALGVRHGIIHTELKLTAAGPRVLEVNGRVGGHVPDLLRRSAGLDVVEVALRLCLGQSPVLPPLAVTAVTYQYMLLPPHDAHTLLSIDGQAAVRAIDGVDIVDVRAVAGPVDWRDGAFGRLGKVYGQVANHCALTAVAELIASAFRPVFAYADDDEKPVGST